MSQSKKSSTKREPIAGHDEGARLTPEQAAEIASGWIIPLLCDDAEIGDFMLILRSICYEPDASERENIVSAIERALEPYSPASNAALNSVMIERLAVWQKGAAQ